MITWAMLGRYQLNGGGSGGNRPMDVLFCGQESAAGVCGGEVVNDNHPVCSFMGRNVLQVREGWDREVGVINQFVCSPVGRNVPQCVGGGGWGRRYGIIPL